MAKTKTDDDENDVIRILIMIFFECVLYNNLNGFIYGWMEGQTRRKVFQHVPFFFYLTYMHSHYHNYYYPCCNNAMEQGYYITCKTVCLSFCTKGERNIIFKFTIKPLQLKR